MFICERSFVIPNFKAFGIVILNNLLVLTIFPFSTTTFINWESLDQAVAVKSALSL